MENFLKILEDDIIIEVVNLVRATKEQADEFKSILLNLIEEGKTKIIVDLHQCDFVDSTFLSTLLIALKAVMKKGGTIKVASPKNEVAELLEATGMRRVFDVHSSVADAIASFN